MKVKDYMNGRIIKCNLNDSLKDISYTMSSNNVGFLAVVDDNDNIIGVITDRDIITGPLVSNIDSIADFLNKNIISIDSEKDIEDAFYLMKKNKISRILVTIKGKYKGVLSIFDLLDNNFKDLFFDTIKEIKEY